MTLLTGFGEELEYIDPLLGVFSGRREDCRQFALQFRVLLLKASNGIPLDISLGAMSFEEHSVERAELCEMASGYSIYLCSAEDLIVHKAFANRPRDWVDIHSIMARQREKLDMNLVWSELEPLIMLKETPETLDQLRDACNKYKL